MGIQPKFRLVPHPYFDDTHRAIFTDISLVDWLEASGCRVLVCVARFLPDTPQNRLGGLTFLVPFYFRLPWRPLAGQTFVLAERPLESR